MKLPWSAAAAVVMAGAVAAAGASFTVGVRKGELKPRPEALARPSAELPQGEEFEGTEEGAWVRTKDGQFILRSTVLLAEEELQDPFMSMKISGTFYPEDVQDADSACRAWTMNPIVRSTGPAPRAWQLEEFRKTGGLK